MYVGRVLSTFEKQTLNSPLEVRSSLSSYTRYFEGGLFMANQTITILCKRA